MKKIVFVFLLGSLFQLKTFAAFGQIDDLVEYTFAKDGGTRCIKVITANKESKYCIDHRLLRTIAPKLQNTIGDVYAGGYPGSENSRKMNEKEMKALFNDIDQFIGSKKYKQFKPDEYVRMQKDRMDSIRNQKPYDEVKYRKLKAFNAIKGFKDDLSKSLNRSIIN